MSKIIQLLLFNGHRLIALHEDGTLTTALLAPRDDPENRLGFWDWDHLKVLDWEDLNHG